MKKVLLAVLVEGLMIAEILLAGWCITKGIIDESKPHVAIGIAVFLVGTSCYYAFKKDGKHHG